MFLLFLLLAIISFRVVKRLTRRLPLSLWKRPKILVVLGSGGHTAEMISLVQALGGSASFVFVAAASDVSSEGKVHAVLGDVEILRIRRSREVGQSFQTSIFTTFLAMIDCIILVLQIQPDAVLVNGPGTCVPVCLAAILVEFFSSQLIGIFFVESFCRVKTLSLTGKLLRPIADEFFVFWPDLARKYSATLLE